MKHNYNARTAFFLSFSARSGTSPSAFPLIFIPSVKMELVHQTLQSIITESLKVIVESLKVIVESLKVIVES